MKSAQRETTLRPPLRRRCAMGGTRNCGRGEGEGLWYVPQMTKIPLLLTTTFLKDPIGTEEQKYLRRLCEMRVRQCHMLLTCRDSNASLHKHGSTLETSLYDFYLVSDLAARTLAKHFIVSCAVLFFLVG